MIDAGTGNDQYLLALSTGLGIADHGAWTLCIDEGGADRYLVGQGHGWGLNKSLAGFIDLGGHDTYLTGSSPGTEGRGNFRTLLQGDRGLFIDK
jgi:hypothetical protein